MENELSIAEAAWDIGLAWSPDRRAEPVIRAFLDLTFQYCRSGKARPNRLTAKAVLGGLSATVPSSDPGIARDAMRKRR